MKRSHRDGTPTSPVLITRAAPSLAEQHATRKRKYAIMMALRLPLLIGAVLCYQIWWLALLLVLLSVPLPWIAVLIANDRPPIRAERVSRYHEAGPANALEAREHPVIDG